MKLQAGKIVLILGMVAGLTSAVGLVAASGLHVYQQALTSGDEKPVQLARINLCSSARICPPKIPKAKIPREFVVRNA